jgi:hypothetical protein
MRVAQFYLEQRKIRNSRKDTLLNCNLNPENVRKVLESILFNSQATVQESQQTFVPVGSPLEVGLFKLL